MFEAHAFTITVKSTGKVLRTIHGYGEDRKAARKDAMRIFRKQYDKTCVELEA